MCQCMRVFFSFLITASCHILVITVSTVNVLIYGPLPASPRAAFVDIFCYATRYVSHCVCEDVPDFLYGAGFGSTALVVMCGSRIAARSSTPLLLLPFAYCSLLSFAVCVCWVMLGHVGLVALRVHLPSRWPLVV